LAEENNQKNTFNARFTAKGWEQTDKNHLGKSGKKTVTVVTNSQKTGKEEITTRNVVVQQSTIEKTATENTGSQKRALRRGRSQGEAASRSVFDYNFENRSKSEREER